MISLVSGLKTYNLCLQLFDLIRLSPFKLVLWYRSITLDWEDERILKSTLEFQFPQGLNGLVQRNQCALGLGLLIVAVSDVDRTRRFLLRADD